MLIKAQKDGTWVHFPGMQLAAYIQSLHPDNNENCMTFFMR